MMWVTHLPTFVVFLQMALPYKTFLPKRLHRLSSALPLVRPKPHLQKPKSSAWPSESVTHGDLLSSHSGQIFHTPNQISSGSKKLQKIQSFFHRFHPTSSSYNSWKHNTDLRNDDPSSIGFRVSDVKSERFQQLDESATRLFTPIPTLTSPKPSDPTQPVSIGVNRNVKQNTFKQVNSWNYDESFESERSFKVDRSMSKIKELPASFKSLESISPDKNPNDYFISPSLSLPTPPTPALLRQKEKLVVPNKIDHLDKKSTHRFRKIRSLDKGCHSEHLKKCGSNVIKEFSAGIVSLSSKCQIRKEFLDCMVQQREIECTPSEMPAASAQDTEPLRAKVTNLLRSVNGCLLL